MILGIDNGESAPKHVYKLNKCHRSQQCSITQYDIR